MVKKLNKEGKKVLLEILQNNTVYNTLCLFNTAYGSIK